MIELSAYEYLWAKDSEYELIEEMLGLYTIYNKVTQMEIIIEDDKTYSEVIQKMMQEGIPVIQAEDISSDLIILPDNLEIEEGASIKVNPQNLASSFWKRYNYTDEEKEEIISKFDEWEIPKYIKFKTGKELRQILYDEE